MPERQEDDRLDGQELEYRVVRSEEVFGGKVEEKQCIQCQTDTHVVHHRDIQIAALHSATQLKHIQYICSNQSIKITGDKLTKVGTFVHPLHCMCCVVQLGNL